MKNVFKTMNSRKKIVLLVLVLALITFSFAAIYVVLKNEYAPITIVNKDSQASLISKLETQGVDYKIDTAGNLFVNEKELGRGQVLLNEAMGGKFSSQGFELFDNADYGMTEQAQKVTYQRALQGELERTVSSLSYVRYARVHLTLESKKLFSKQTSPSSKASITVFTEANESLNAQRVQGIQSLVADSIEGLVPGNVTVFNADGILLSRRGGMDSDVSVPAMSQSKERELEAKIDKLLSLYLSPSQFAATVNIVWDLDEKTEVINSVLTESDGNGVVTKESLSTEKSPKVNSASETISESRELEYAYGSQMEKRVSKPGRIKLITVAAAVVAELDSSQQKSLRELIASSVGISEARGDQISVEFFKPLDTLEIEQYKQDVVAQDVVADTHFKKDHFLNTEINQSLTFVLLFLVLGSGVVLTIHRIKLQKRREKALIELTEWLAKGEVSHV